MEEIWNIAWKSALAGIAFLTPVIPFIKWLTSRWEKRAFAKYQIGLNQGVTARNKAALVAELLAEWGAEKFDPLKANRLLFECTLWLPDDEARQVNHLLAHRGDRDSRKILLAIRNVIQGEKTTLTVDDVTWFKKGLASDPRKGL